MVPKWIRPLFLGAAAYDLLFGLIYLVGWRAVYALFAIEPPNHPSYVQFAAATVAVFGLGFWMVAAAPQRNRDLIKLGVLFKLAYGGLVVRYLLTEHVAPVWVAFGACDLAFAAAFIAALRALPADDRSVALQEV
ncbi:MAG: hypothetical protein HYU66_27355 [Armatimonadetes bacterium]|nr:hypothetical protein [Armatimonadota bacterium]